MDNKPSNSIRIHPIGTSTTDTKKAKMLAASAPDAFRKAQDVLTAANKYINKSGLFSTEKSRVQKLQSECYELARALKNDGFMSDELIQNGKAFVMVEFFSLFSDAYPNWQKEYEALNRFIKMDSYLREVAVDANFLDEAASQNPSAETISEKIIAARDTVLQHTKALADQGNPEAQRQLGAIYFAGKVVPQDYKEAVKWYRLAADQGDALSQFNLGLFYTHEQYVPQDFKEAVKWYRLAANQGHSAAQYELGKIYSQGKVVPHDYEEAVKWYRLAADQGRLSAQYELGKIYSQGKVVSQDYKEAMKWYQLAADQGDSAAQYELGVMYHNGQGVQQDYAQAMMWYLIAEVDCETSADQKLRQLKPLSTPVQIAEAQRLSREWLDAHQSAN